MLGWGWLTGDDPAEADTAARLRKELGLAGYVADAEAPYEAPWTLPAPERARILARSVRFAERYDQLDGNTPRAVTSYGRADLHLLPWPDWYRRGWRFIPQAYANDSPLLTVPACLDGALQRGWDPRQVHMLLGEYRGALGWASLPEYLAGLRYAASKGSYGVGLYAGDNITNPDTYRILAAANRYRSLS